MSNVFVEVDEAIKQERLEKLWQEYGGLIIAFIAALILGTGATAGYKSWKTSENQKKSTILLTALDNKAVTAEELLSLKDEVGDGLGALSQIKAASLYIESGEHEKARDVYNNLKNDSTVAKSFRQVSEYMVAALMDGNAGEEKITAFNKIIEDPKNPWRYHAHLNIALLKANIHKDSKAALAHIKIILDSEDAVVEVQQKAQSLKILYSLTEKI